MLATFTLPPDHSRVAIVTPLIGGGSLASILEWRSTARPSRKRRKSNVNGSALAEDEVKAVVRQILEGLVYLHANGFLHVSCTRERGHTALHTVTHFLGKAHTCSVTSKQAISFWLQMARYYLQILGSEAT